MWKSKVISGLAVMILAVPGFAQPAQQPSAQASQPAEPALVVNRGTYTLGPDDAISIKVVDAEEISEKSIRIAANGFITLPMVGRVKVSGLTVEELQLEITNRLKQYIREPDVSINVTEMKSQPVSVFGAVRSPGVQQLSGRKTLVEILSLAGGPREDAGYSVKITRQKEWGTIPLANAKLDGGGQFSVAEVSLKQIMNASNMAENILIMPNDVITVPKAEMVYVIGEVKKAGGYVLNEKSTVSVLQALSMSGGLENKTAVATKAKILRLTPGSDMKRAEIPVNLKNILAGKDQDVPMESDDILFVPNSKTRSAVVRGMETALQVAAGIAIYRSY